MRRSELIASVGGKHGVLREPNLFLDFTELRRRLLAQLRYAVAVELAAGSELLSAAEQVGAAEVLLDCFLLAAGLSQILEDYLQRDVTGLRRASAHVPPWLAAPMSLAARAEFRLRAHARTARRLARRQRALAGLVAGLADRVAGDVLAREHGSTVALTRPAAAALLRDAETSLFPLESFPARLRREIQRLPNCFRAFDQHPADCLRLVEHFAERWPNRSRPLLVVGLRTSGSYLAPLTASFLTAAGYRSVTAITLRPGSFLDRRHARAIAAVGAAGGLGLLVDDTPRTGTQLDQAASEVRARGLAEVVLLLAPPGDTGFIPERLLRHPMVLLPSAECEASRRLAPQAVEETLEELLVGREIHAEGVESLRVVVAGVTVESVLPRPPRRGHTGARVVARILDGRSGREVHASFYVEGVGLGYFGRHEEVVATAVAEHVPRVYGVRDGFLVRDWLPEDRRIDVAELRRGGSAFSQAVARYLEARRSALPLADDVTLRLPGRDATWERIALMLGQAFGPARQLVRPLTHHAAKRLVAVERPSVTDACTRTDHWFDGEAGGLRKLGFEQRASSNVGTQSCDPVFDLAEAAASAEEDGALGLADRLRRDYESLTGEPIDDERWLLYRLLHHLSRYRAALDEASADPRAWEHPFSRALVLERAMASAQRTYVADRYVGELAPRAEGPLCAIDVDGVLETRWTAFPALAPAGALALRLLSLHGYRAVLVTGRALEEVRDRCAAYRLPGGVAEYGAVIYDHVGGRVRDLLTRDDHAALDALRGALAQLDGVHLDAAHVHSLRAHTVAADGVRSALPSETIAAALSAAGVEGRIRVVPGDLQTDFIAAGVDKGRGLVALAETLDGAERPAPIALAVGDTASDLPMLALARRSFAPANAQAELRGDVQRLRRTYQSGLLEAVRRELGHSARRCPACRRPRPSSPESGVLLTVLAALDGGGRNRVARAGALALRLAADGYARKRRTGSVPTTASDAR
jgi:hydroxymethylpyrimidine pyrophosphatase-like HAD family hydrolase